MNDGFNFRRGSAFALALGSLGVNQLTAEGDFEATSDTTIRGCFHFNFSREGIFKRYGEVIGIALEYLYNQQRF